MQIQVCRAGDYIESSYLQQVALNNSLQPLIHQTLRRVLSQEMSCEFTNETCKSGLSICHIELRQLMSLV